MIHFKCGKCGKKLAAKDESAGKRAKCPGCGQVMRVPARQPVGAGSAAPPADRPPEPTIPSPSSALPRVGRAFYTRSLWIGFGAGVLFTAACIVLIAAGGVPGPWELLLSLGPMIYAGVVFLVLLHKMWTAIQAGPARTTPGQAVGFLFIPLFNLIWAFSAIWGWAKDYNAFIAQRGIEAPPARERLALAVCILMAASIVPCLGIAAALVTPFFIAAFAGTACDGINAIAAQPEKATGALPEAKQAADPTA